MIFSVVGARPNFVKMVPIINEIAGRNLPQKIVHTQQHYSAEMSETFMKQLGFPEPDFRLSQCPKNPAQQIAHILQSFARLCSEHQPKLVILAGDVNSTLACALAASKMGIPIAHVESGLRSFDRSMPEEVNRVVTDHLSELLFTTEESANYNLRQEGIDSSRIHFCGNSMIDTLKVFLKQLPSISLDHRPISYLPGSYGVVTLHRPENVDSREQLMRLVEILEFQATKLPLIFPLHPRTKRRLCEFGLGFNQVHCIEPLSYPIFLALIAQARLVLTDSGGVQEESSFLGVPCLTLRKNTERPVTVEQGTNQLIGTDPVTLDAAIEKRLTGQLHPPGLPSALEFIWDGKSAGRIVDVIVEWMRTDLNPKASRELPEDARLMLDAHQVFAANPYVL